MDGLKRFSLIKEKSFENSLIRALCKLAPVKKLCTSPYLPETNGQCKCFNATLINMLGTLPTHAKKNWQEWITTLTHVYNCTISSVSGFSPYFLMFGHTPKISLDIVIGVTLIEQGGTSHQNYVKKLKARLEWAYQIAHENNQKESECLKKYYYRKMRCMSLRPYDLVLVHVKAPTGNHKIADWLEVIPHCVLIQLANQPVFKVQPIDAEDDENIWVLHRNMFPGQLVTDPIPKTDDKHVALMEANLLMDLYFDD